MTQNQFPATFGGSVPVWAAAESLAVLAVINQIRDCITVDTIHYIAMYIPDSFNFDTVGKLLSSKFGI